MISEKYARDVWALLEKYTHVNGRQKEPWAYDHIFQEHLRLMLERLREIQNIPKETKTKARFKEKLDALESFYDEYMAIAKPKKAA